METRSLIEDRLTLPKSRKACRSYDVPVSTKEYNRLRALNAGGKSKYSEDVELDQIKLKVAEGCEQVTVEKGKGPKVAKASSLRPHDVEKGYTDRIEKIGNAIVKEIIYSFKDSSTTPQDFAQTLGDFSADRPLNVENIEIPSFEWPVDDGGDPIDMPLSPSEDMRENFLYELELFVKREVNEQIQSIADINFDGESIWDDTEMKVALRANRNDCRHIHADIFFGEIEEELVG